MLKRARLLCYLVLCVSRAVLSIVLGAWSVRCVSRVDWVDCRCFLSFVFLSGARRLELSPCNIPTQYYGLNCVLLNRATTTTALVLPVVTHKDSLYSL